MFRRVQKTAFSPASQEKTPKKILKPKMNLKGTNMSCKHSGHIVNGNKSENILQKASLPRSDTISIKKVHTQNSLPVSRSSDRAKPNQGGSEDLTAWILSGGETKSARENNLKPTSFSGNSPSGIKGINFQYEVGICARRDPLVGASTSISGSKDSNTSLDNPKSSFKSTAGSDSTRADVSDCCHEKDTRETDEESAADIFPWLMTLEDTDSDSGQNSDKLLETFIAKQNKSVTAGATPTNGKLRRLSLELLKLRPINVLDGQERRRRNSYSTGDGCMEHKQVLRVRKNIKPDQCQSPSTNDVGVYPKIPESMSYDEILHPDEINQLIEKNSGIASMKSTGKRDEEPADSSRSTVSCSTTNGSVSSFLSTATSTYASEGECSSTLSTERSMSTESSSTSSHSRRTGTNQTASFLRLRGTPLSSERSQTTIETETDSSSNKSVSRNRSVGTSVTSEDDWDELLQDTELGPFCAQVTKSDGMTCYIISSREQDSRSEISSPSHTTDSTGGTSRRKKKGKPIMLLFDGKGSSPSISDMKKDRYRSIQKLRQNSRLVSSERKTLINPDVPTPQVSGIKIHAETKLEPVDKWMGFRRHESSSDSDFTDEEIKKKVEYDIPNYLLNTSTEKHPMPQPIENTRSLGNDYLPTKMQKGKVEKKTSPDHSLESGHTIPDLKNAAALERSTSAPQSVSNCLSVHRLQESTMKPKESVTISVISGHQDGKSAKIRDGLGYLSQNPASFSSQSYSSTMFHITRENSTTSSLILSPEHPKLQALKHSDISLEKILKASPQLSQELTTKADLKHPVSADPSLEGSDRYLLDSFHPCIKRCDRHQSDSSAPRLERYADQQSALSDHRPEEHDLQKRVETRVIAALNSLHLDLSALALPFYPTLALCAQLDKLQRLTLSDNCLTSLPHPSLSLLPALRWLDLRFNTLESLPEDELLTLKCLEVLLLQENRLKALPLKLGSLPKLSTLQVAGNPLVFPPAEVVQGGTEIIMTFLRTRRQIQLNIHDGGCWSHVSGDCAMPRHFPTNYNYDAIDQSVNGFLKKEEDSDESCNFRGSTTSSSFSSSILSKVNQNQHQPCGLPGLHDWLTSNSCSVRREADARTDRQESTQSTPDSGRETLRSLEPPSTPTSPCLLTPNSEFPSAAVRYDEVAHGRPYLELYDGKLKSGREESILRDLNNASTIHEPYRNTKNSQFHAVTCNVSVNTLRTRGHVGYMQYGRFRKNRLTGKETRPKAKIRTSVRYKNDNISSNKVLKTMRTNDLCIRNSFVSTTTGKTSNDEDPGVKFRLPTKESFEFLPSHTTKPSANCDFIILEPEAAGFNQPLGSEIHRWACDYDRRDELRLIPCLNSNSTRTLPPLRGGDEKQKPWNSRFILAGQFWDRSHDSYDRANTECFQDGFEAPSMCRRKSLHVVLQRAGIQQTEDGEDEEVDTEMERVADREVDDDSLDGDLGEGYRKATIEDDGRENRNNNGSAKKQSVSSVEPVLVELRLPAPVTRGSSVEGAQRPTPVPTNARWRKLSLGRDRPFNRASVLEAAGKGKKLKLEKKRAGREQTQKEKIRQAQDAEDWRERAEEQRRQRSLSFDQDQFVPPALLAPFTPDMETFTPRTRIKALERTAGETGQRRHSPNLEAIVAEARTCLAQLSLQATGSQLKPSASLPPVIAVTGEQQELGELQQMRPIQLGPDQLVLDDLAPEKQPPDQQGPDQLGPDELGPDQLGPGNISAVVEKLQRLRSQLRDLGTTAGTQ